jgi:hypothetical protein
MQSTVLVAAVRCPLCASRYEDPVPVTNVKLLPYLSIKLRVKYLLIARSGCECHALRNCITKEPPMDRKHEGVFEETLQCIVQARYETQGALSFR